MRSLFYLIRKCKATWCETTAKCAERVGSKQTGNGLIRPSGVPLMSAPASLPQYRPVEVLYLINIHCHGFGLPGLR